MTSQSAICGWFGDEVLPFGRTTHWLLNLQMVPLFYSQSLTEDFTVNCHIRISIETDHILTSDHQDSPKFFSQKRGISNLSPTKKPFQLEAADCRDPGTRGTPSWWYPWTRASPSGDLRSCSYRGGTGWSFWPKMLGFSPTNAIGISPWDFPDENDQHFWGVWNGG